MARKFESNINKAVDYFTAKLDAGHVPSGKGEGVKTTAEFLAENRKSLQKKQARYASGNAAAVASLSIGQTVKTRMGNVVEIVAIDEKNIVSTSDGKRYSASTLSAA